MQSRKICFVSTESDEREFFAGRFEGQELSFVNSLNDVPKDTEVVSIFISEKITADFLAKYSNLRLIATRTTGCDHVDVDACQTRNIVVANVSTYGEVTVAEHTFALILNLSRRIGETQAAARTGHFSPENLRGFDLRGKTLGVIGAGRVGLHVIRIALGFGMKVIACEINPHPFLSELLDFTYVNQDDLLKDSDVISLHLPLTKDNAHLLNRETLACCRPGVFIINTARGGLIDTGALSEALDSGQVGGAGLDVVEEERVFRGGATALLSEQIISHIRSSSSEHDRIAPTPQRMEEISRYLASSSLLRHSRVVFTPHVAYNSLEARERITLITAENIESFLKGTSPARSCP